MRHESLHAQAAIHVWCQQRVNPARIFGAAFVAIVSTPQGDNGEKARFLIGNHDQASGKTGDFLQRTDDRGRNCRLRATRFLRLGYEFNAQSCNWRIPRRSGSRRVSSGRRCLWEWKRHIIGSTCMTHGTCHNTSMELAHPWERGGASLPVQGRLKCAHWGTWGPGKVPHG
jgi:hypothetical protein